MLQASRPRAARGAEAKGLPQRFGIKGPATQDCAVEALAAEVGDQRQDDEGANEGPRRIDDGGGLPGVVGGCEQRSKAQRPVQEQPGRVASVTATVLGWEPVGKTFEAKLGHEQQSHPDAHGPRRIAPPHQGAQSAEDDPQTLAPDPEAPVGGIESGNKQDQKNHFPCLHGSGSPEVFELEGRSSRRRYE